MSQINVLDKGFVRLVDHMGDDSRIVQSARVSYADGTKTVREDKGLIDYLMRHRHTSPFEQVEFTFHIKLPLFIMAQLVRHRTSNLNQMSARYSVMKDEFYIPEKIRLQDNNNKQGSEFSEVEDEQYFIQIFQKNANQSYKDYETLLEAGVAREMARMVLPQNLYTEVYWKQDLHNLLHLIKLRMDSHAQWEIQQYANAMYELIQPIVPWTIESWERNSLNSVHLNSVEKEILKKSMKTEEPINNIVNDLIENKEISKGKGREIKQKLEFFKGE